jgi:predicted nuclease with TOPRIM domain
MGENALTPVELVAELERERDELRERLGHFERGDTHAAYRDELARLEKELTTLREGNEALRARIAGKRRSWKGAPTPDGALVSTMEELLRLLRGE